MPQRLVDWAALLKVEPDLPKRLNGAFFSIEKLVRDLQAYQLDLREDLEASTSSCPTSARAPGLTGAAGTSSSRSPSTKRAG